MKIWLGVLALTSIAGLTSAGTCQKSLGGNCGDSSRPRDQNCCENGYCQPWNSGYYQCIALPARCQTQETDIDYAGNDIKTVYGLQPDQCCAECAKTTDCQAYTFVNQNPDGKTACYLKTSDAGRVEKKGAVSAKLDPLAPPTPPAMCPTLDTDFDYYGNDIKKVTGNSVSDCCDACSKTDKCLAYTFVPTTSSCYLKSSADGKVAKSGVWSGQLLTTAPPQPPANCPTQEVNVDYYGNDLKSLNGVTQTECCDACGKTDKCVAYTYISKTSDCYLKSSTAGKVTKVGAISGQVPVTPPPPPANCPTQLVDVDYYGNDLKKLPGITQTQCCDECGNTAQCVAYTFIAKSDDGKSACYLKSSTAGKVAKVGAISGDYLFTKPPPPPPNCPTQETNIDYYGNDIQTLTGVTQTECCDTCGKTAKCVAYTYLAKAADGKSACYLKSSTAGRVAKAGAISGQYSLPPSQNCGNPEQDIDYNGNDIKTLYAVTQNECCDSCSATAFCIGYTFVPTNPDGKTACYLKSSDYGRVKKVGAISAKVFSTPPPPPLACPITESNVDYYGNDIKVIRGGSQNQCCTDCASTPYCVLYTYVGYNADGKSACYLKSSTAGKVAKAGAVSAVVTNPLTTAPPTPPPPPANCPIQETNVDYYGNDLKSLYSVTQTQCCDECGKTDKCVAYSYVASTSGCYLKSSTAGKVAKTGVVSGSYKYIPVPTTAHALRTRL